MSDIFTIFNPGMEYTRRQKDLEKILVVEAPDGAPGPKPLDLESGVVTISVPRPAPGSGSADTEEQV